MKALQHRALGTAGLLLIALMVWASGRGRPGRTIISLVTAIGGIVDRVSVAPEHRGRADEHRRPPAARPAIQHKAQ